MTSQGVGPVWHLKGFSSDHSKYFDVVKHLPYPLRRINIRCTVLYIGRLEGTFNVCIKLKILLFLLGILYS